MISRRSPNRIRFPKVRTHGEMRTTFERPEMCRAILHTDKQDGSFLRRHLGSDARFVRSVDDGRTAIIKGPTKKIIMNHVKKTDTGIRLVRSRLIKLDARFARP